MVALRREMPSAKGSFGSFPAGHALAFEVVKSDADDWSGRMQVHGQARAVTLKAPSCSYRAGVLRPATLGSRHPVSTELRCCGPQQPTHLPDAASSSTNPMQQIPFRRNTY